MSQTASPPAPVHFAQLDAGHRVVQAGQMPAAGAAASLQAMNAVEITEAQFQQIRVQPRGHFLLQDGVLTWQPPPPPGLAVVQAAATAEVDRQAEQIREQFLTPGSGQALEYEMTFQDAVKMHNTGDPLDPADFPWIVAEQAALAAVGRMLDLRAVSGAILWQRDAWQAVGAEIKRVRREAKLRIDACTTADAVQAVMTALKWPPTPG